MNEIIKKLEEQFGVKIKPRKRVNRPVSVLCVETNDRKLLEKIQYAARPYVVVKHHVESLV